MLKKGHNSEKNAIWIVSLDSMDCALDSEHILRVSSKYLQLWQRYYKMSKFLHDNNDDEEAKAIAIP